MFFDRKAWLEYRNDSGERIPAFGIVRITGVVVPEPGRVLLTVAKPDAYGCQLQCAVNGPVPIDADRYGLCARGPFVAALYDTGDGTPAVGQKWGPRSGGWKLRKNTGGFSVVGVTKSSAGLVLVQPAPMRSLVGKTNNAHAKGGTGDVSIYAGTLGSESDTGADLTGVFNRFADLASGKWVRCVWNEQSSDWELAAGECS